MRGELNRIVLPHSIIRLSPPTLEITAAQRWKARKREREKRVLRNRERLKERERERVFKEERGREKTDIFHKTFQTIPTDYSPTHNQMNLGLLYLSLSLSSFISLSLSSFISLMETFSLYLALTFAEKNISLLKCFQTNIFESPGLVVMGGDSCSKGRGYLYWMDIF